MIGWILMRLELGNACGWLEMYRKLMLRLCRLRQDYQKGALNNFLMGFPPIRHDSSTMTLLSDIEEQLTLIYLI